ncbi:MAG TPA: BlaI/MecI/CopY family transcriptional regulator [Chitinophagaceae bacterium]|nr:BlaI/MecI/CopY family transcriptional regulator [Chitinophagaceae bacterium]
MSNNNREVSPTNAEIEILKVLWEYGPSTVRFVNDILKEKKGELHYTSTLKLMQIMTDKKLVKRDESVMKHIYSPLAAENKIMNFLLDRFIKTMYNGSKSKLILQLVGNKKISEKDLKEIKSILNSIEQLQ